MHFLVNRVVVYQSLVVSGKYGKPGYKIFIANLLSMHLPAAW